MITLANSMFGFFKRFFPQTGGSAALPAPAAVAEKMAPIPMPALPASAAPAKRESAPPANTPPPAISAPPSGPTVPLPLHEIIARLPNSLAGQVLARPHAIFSLPADFVMEQLRTGAVRIPFGQLRQGAPAGTFASTDALDEEMVELPLSLVLPAVSPRGFARRRDQRHLDVPDDVTGIFETKTAHAKRTETPVAIAPPAPRLASENVQISTSFVSKPVTSNTSAPVPAKPTASFSTSLNGAQKIASTPPVAAPTSAFASARTSAPLPFATKRFVVQPDAAPAHAPIPLPIRAAPAATEDDFITTTVEAVSAGWPEAIRQQIEQFDLQHAPLSIPIDRVEPGLKSGRIMFVWSEVSGWIKAPRPAMGNSETPVELPLRVVAPLYLKKRPPGPARRMAPTVEHVPDVFAAAHRMTPAPQPAVVAVAPPAAVAMPAPRIVPEDESTSNILGEIFNEMSKTQWTPQEIVERTCALHGIAGALLAARDGLLVAGKLPAPMRAETMAAFIPQMFSRVGGSTEAAQLGTLRALKITAGSSPCSIFKAGALYLAVLGRTGQQIPETALERIAEAASQMQNILQN